jgi:hypothetical protein
MSNLVLPSRDVRKRRTQQSHGAVERKEIPCIRIGRLIRIPRAWLRRAAGQTEPSKPEELA